VWLAGLERAVQPILQPMALLTEPRVMLDLAAQKLLAFWAVKTAFMLELALRRNRYDRRLIKGYVPTDPELAWLWAHSEPPPRSMVWLGAQQAHVKVPGERTREVTLDPRASTGTPVRTKGQAGACPDRTRAIPCKVRVAERQSQRG
jgi:hypothetical protein